MAQMGTDGDGEMRFWIHHGDTEQGHGGWGPDFLGGGFLATDLRMGTAEDGEGRLD